MTGGNSTTGGNSATGGNNTTGGNATGGNNATGGAPATGGVTVQKDCQEQELAKPGDSTTTSRKYLNLGDIRLINNRWGSDELGCNGSTYKVWTKADKTFGYDFNRPTCGGERGKPDYPEIEFGVAPFGKDSPLTTSPKCSSTTHLPKQLKDLTSASLTIDSFNSTYQNPGYYNTNFEFWISKKNPATESDGGVFAEIIVFLGWDGVRMNAPKGWPCDKSGNLTAGGSSFVLCHQSDTWSDGKWRFYNFNLSNGPQNNFNGKVDIKAFIDWVRSKYSGFTDDMWLTRIEVGTEVDDNTSGSASFKNLTFEINGTSKSVEFGQ